jgi:hypothetical protein
MDRVHRSQSGACKLFNLDSSIEGILEPDAALGKTRFDAAMTGLCHWKQNLDTLTQTSRPRHD